MILFCGTVLGKKGVRKPNGASKQVFLAEMEIWDSK